MKKELRLRGLDCAACAAELENELSSIEGISAVSVAFVSQKLTIEYDSKAALQRAIAKANAFEEVRVVMENDGGMSASNAKKRGVSFPRKRILQWVSIGVSALSWLMGILLENISQSLTGTVFAYVSYAVAYVCAGYPVLKATVKNLAKGRIFDENFLMTVASIGAACIGEYSESVLVMLLYQIGEILQEMAVDSSRRSLTELMALKSENATVFRGREQVILSPEEIVVGDILFIKAGEKVPVDGVLIDKTATVDTKSLTGEAEPRERSSGEELLSGSINVGATFTMRATRPYSDSAVKKILDVVENASAAKAAPEKFITKFARWYTPIVCALALVLAFLPPLLTGVLVEEVWQFKDFTRWLRSALTFLVVSCPCALIISVPLTYFSGIGSCAKRGVLVKGATHLDTLSKAKIVAFDKTGTLTKGEFTVRAIHPVDGVSPQDLLTLVAAVERHSSHPIAKAFAHTPTADTLRVENASERAGRGLIARIEGEEIVVGNPSLLAEEGILFSPVESAYTLVYAAKGGVFWGYIEVGDTPREEVAETLARLQRLGVSRQVMLTGDSAKRAESTARELGIAETHAALLPLDKLACAESLKREGVLAYVGDGINDAPVMTAADCSFSMGKLGSAAAVETSDFVLITDDLRGVPRAVATAKKTARIVKENILFSIAAKIAFMVLGALEILPLWGAVLADVGVMLLAVCNSFRVRTRKSCTKSKKSVILNEQRGIQYDEREKEVNHSDGQRA